MNTVGCHEVQWTKDEVFQSVHCGIIDAHCLGLYMQELMTYIWTGDTTDWICRAHLTMKGFVVPVSACILMLIAMERFLLICFIPGIQMQRTHIVLSLVIIFCIGLLCAIPMGLHVRAIDLFKELLFLGTAGVYALIFLFVWRHESFMYEKYGNPKMKGDWCNIEINNPQLSRTELSAANLERRRKPHVRTAQTLALVAANFIISYTPYLVYTTMPIQIRQIVLLKDKPHWTIQVRRILFYMYFINSALNPITYSCMNRIFSGLYNTDLKITL
ncbi:unnamed protein product [Schistosoma margrebowiei]|uniref:Uncharacterized protein n=1 Tax=Schistosoma margrebowiei TaxID=48269 RepID=A0A183ME68_9TREM|nr:unnamed protein product [Schistosoma margrebowiei]